jgi:hypothetical protein
MTESEAIPRVSFTTLIIHDRPEIGPHLDRWLRNQGFPTYFHATGAEALRDLYRGGLLGVEVVVVHKDLGELDTDDPVEKIVDFIHEDSPTTRIIFLSGEFPDGKNHVLQMKGDGYCRPNDLDWLVGEIQKGALTPDQIELRGKPGGLSMSPEEEPLPPLKLW